MPNKKGKYYLTTAIAYTSAKPHIGNIYEIVLADAIARYKRLEGYDVFFMTGTDEHGQKIEERAALAEKSPKQYVDEVAGLIRSLFDMMNVSYDRFIRTTEENHKLQVQRIFKRLYEQGDIYKGQYEGMYCKACESFYTPSQLEDGKCPEGHDHIEPMKEETYFLNLQKYAGRLIQHIETHPEFIQPESRKNEIVNNFIKPGLQDLSVSRKSIKWGIPVDFDPEHVIYVWIDALSNYITGIGFDGEGKHTEQFTQLWPADLHLIGKDILRFHTIYWPVVLMALDLPLPKQIFGHPWLLVGEGKMSKSMGNVIYSDDLVNLFGVDAVRYLMLHEIPFAQDGTLTYDIMIERINSDLANVLGNLVNRSLSMLKKYFNGEVRNPGISTEFDESLIALVEAAPKKVQASMEQLKVQEAIDHIFEIFRRSNKYIDETMPWALAKDEEKLPQLQTVLYNLLESIRTGAVLLQAYLPDTSNKILDLLQTQARDFDSLEKFGALEDKNLTDFDAVLFKRLDAEEVMERVNPKPKVLKTKEEITIDTFNQVDIRVGKVLSCENHPDSDKLLVSKVEIDGTTRQIVSGLRPAYEAEDLQGKQFLVVVNLKPVKLRGVMSEGMLLVAKKDNQIQLMTLDDLNNGALIQ